MAAVRILGNWEALVVVVDLATTVDRLGLFKSLIVVVGDDLKARI